MTLGGASSFQTRLGRELQKRGNVVLNESFGIRKRADAVLINGALGKGMPKFLASRLAGVRSVHRLDGMYWRYKINKTSTKSRVRQAIYNRSMRLVRSISSSIVYQSEFAKQWWEREAGVVKTDSAVIYNAVDLDEFSPQLRKPNSGSRRALIAEGDLEKDVYTSAVLKQLPGLLRKGNAVESVSLYGKISEEYSRELSEVEGLTVYGPVARERMPAIIAQHDVYVSMDVHAACPNTPIEAMASGLPVAGFSTGALPELVDDSCGAVVPYGSDAWKLGPPDVNALADGIARIIDSLEDYKESARSTAEDRFGIETAADKYLEMFSRD